MSLPVLTGESSAERHSSTGDQRLVSSIDEALAVTPSERFVLR